MVDVKRLKSRVSTLILTLRVRGHRPIRKVCKTTIGGLKDPSSPSVKSVRKMIRGRYLPRKKKFSFPTHFRKGDPKNFIKNRVLVDGTREYDAPF